MGVIHRDLKPANVMVTREEHGDRPDRRVKATVLDFGLAQTSGVAADGTQLSGTAGYLAPEAALGRPPDARSDIYSLGVILFEMVTGERPFPGQDLRAVAAAALRERARLVTDLDPRLPPALAQVIARALAAAPEQRFASAADLAEALRGVDATAATPTSAIPHRPPAGGRFRYWISAAALLVTLSAVGIGVIPKPPTVKATSAVVAVLPLLNATADPAVDDLGAGIADVLISTLAQVPGVTMVSRDATLAHGSRREPVESVARALGADLVVDGVVRKSGNTARVTLSLLRPGSKLIAWSRTYDAAFEDMFTLQNEAASALSEALQVTLTPEQRRRIERPLTTSSAALAEYVQGRSFFERRDLAGNIDHSIALLQSAIAKDPRFARAHATLGQAYWARYRESHDDGWADKALLETTEALRLDPEDAAAHHALAVVLEGRGRTTEAVEELRKAISLQPGNDEAHNQLGQMLCAQGRREEGVAELRRAVTLRPNY
jgi:TolB-like protein